MIVPEKRVEGLNCLVILPGPDVVNADLERVDRVSGSGDMEGRYRVSQGGLALKATDDASDHTEENCVEGKRDLLHHLPDPHTFYVFILPPFICA